MYTHLYTIILTLISVIFLGDNKINFEKKVKMVLCTRKRVNRSKRILKLKCTQSEGNIKRKEWKITKSKRKTFLRLTKTLG